MTQDDVIFTEDFYSEHLSAINGINFTRREIDVIACRLNGREKRKEIASFLSISENTVRTHIQNMSMKIGNKRFLDFIGMSPQYSLIQNNYYSSLRNSLAFEKSLKEISRLKREEEPACLVVYWQAQKLKNALIYYLRNHLAQAGIKVEVREQYFDQKIEDIEKQSHILIFLIEKNNQIELPEEFSALEFVDLSEQKNYYFSVFEILKKLLPSFNLEKIIGEFKEKLETLNNPFDTTFRIPLTLTSKNYGKSENSLKKMDDGPFSIRSDLIVPTEAILLDRPYLINQIEQKLNEKQDIQIVALVGIGGAGKSTVARYYARQQSAKVIWEIHADTKRNLINSFENLAYALSITEEDKKILRALQEIKNPHEKEKKIIFFVRERLKLHSEWLLIYDNVESFTDIQKYFPYDVNVWGKGKVIITTRNTNIQNNSQINNIIQMAELDYNESLSLFIKIMHNGDIHKITSTEEGHTQKFLNDIPHFPLDISIAAYYLKTTGINYDKYIEYLSRHNKTFTSVQENLLKEAGSYTNTRYSIITLTLKRLIETDKDFRDLLLFIGLLDSQNIPRSLLDTYKNSILVDKFIYNLKKYSLIMYELPSSFENNFFLSIHRSTQEIILAYFNGENLEKNNKSIQLIASSLETYISDTIYRENFSIMIHLASHCEKFLSHNGVFASSIGGSIGGALGIIHFYLGNYIIAKKFLEEGLTNLENNPNENHGRIAQFLTYLGMVYRDLGNLKKAKDLLEQSLKIFKKQILEKHIGVARSLGYLGIVFKELGKYEKAKNLLEQSLKILKRQVPKDYIGIARAFAHLGNVYRSLGDYEKSKSFLEQSLISYRKYFLENHAGVAWVLMLLGNVYRNLGNCEKAKSLFEQGLIIYKEHYPENHIGVAWALARLANVYRKLGDYENAKSLFKQNLAIYKKHFPKDHIEIAWVLECLASVYSELGNYEKAKDFLEKSLTIYEKNYGNNHNKMAGGLRRLGKIYLLNKDMETAENLISKALEIFQQNKHPQSYLALRNLAEIYLKKSMDAENKRDILQSKDLRNRAINHLKQAMKGIKTHFPKDSPYIASIESELKMISK